MAKKFQPFQYLYQHIRLKDVRLWETLNRLRAGLEKAVYEDSDIVQGLPCKDKATFGVGIGAVQPIGSDLTNHYEVRHAGKCIEAVANSKDPGTGSIVLDILRTRDSGVSWYSVFPNSARLTLTAGVSNPRDRVTAFSENDDMQVGDMLRLDMSGSSDWKSIEVVLKWG